MIGGNVAGKTMIKNRERGSNLIMAKKEAVQDIFNDIAPKYDALNHILSMNIDKIWRKKAIKYLKSIPIGNCSDKIHLGGGNNVIGSTGEGVTNGKKTKDGFVEIGNVRLLDVACGTGDFSLAAARAGVGKITGIDISENMLLVGNLKVVKAGLQQKITLQPGDSENMEFETASFDAVTVAFGVRNFEHLELGLKEIYRVLRPGGKAVILEFSMPEYFPMKQLYKFYFCNVLPVVGGWLSGNRGAYNYLPASVLKFPQGETFLGIMKECGFSAPIQKRLSFGIASIYVGVK